MEDQPGIRYIEDVETLRAMAEPTRMAILSALLKPPWPRIASVKELAAELDMPQTRLYRHIRQLEDAGLIEVAETRMVSGILEQRYRASQRDMLFRPDFVRTHVDDAMAAFHVMIDQFARAVIAADENASYKPVIIMSDPRIPAEAAEELGHRVHALIEWLNGIKEDPDGVPVNLMMGFYAD